MRTFILSALVLGALSLPAAAQICSVFHEDKSCKEALPAPQPSGSMVDNVSNSVGELQKGVVAPSYARGAASEAKGVIEIQREHKQDLRPQHVR